MPRSENGIGSLHVADDIVPLAEFKAHLSEVVRGLRSRGRPVVVTQNGKPAAVVMSPAEFDRLSYNARFLSAVEEGLRDVREGHVISDAELGAMLDERFGRPRKAKPARR